MFFPKRASESVSVVFRSQALHSGITCIFLSCVLDKSNTYNVYRVDYLVHFASEQPKIEDHKFKRARSSKPMGGGMTATKTIVYRIV